MWEGECLVEVDGWWGRWLARQPRILALTALIGEWVHSSAALDPRRVVCSSDLPT